MKKVVYLLMIFQLILFFGLGSDALAKKKKLDVTNTEWLIQGTAKMYLAVENAEINSPQAEAKKPKEPKGPYLGSMVGGIGLAFFDLPENGARGVVAPMVATDPGAPGWAADVVAGFTAEYNLDEYTLKGNTITATDGDVLITGPGGSPTIEDYDGPIDATFKFTKKGTFTGTVKYTVNGVRSEIQVSGKLLGKFEDLTP